MLLLAAPIVAQQWHFTIDEYQDAERKELRGVRSVLVVNNALVQPNDFGHSTVLDGDHKSGISIPLNKALLYSLSHKLWMRVATLMRLSCWMCRKTLRLIIMPVNPCLLVKFKT